MGLPVTVYRYTDAGAPQITNGKPSEWINILKKVLVEGYGSKAPLGWTLEFEDVGTYKAAFRNSVVDGGTGGYVRFSSINGGDSSNTGIIMKAALGMTAIDAFIKPLYHRGFGINNSYRGWEIIGTSRGFYLIVHYTVNLLYSLQGYAQDSYVFFIGDIQSSTENDAGAFTIATASSATADTNLVSGLTESQVNMHAQLYGTDGSNTNLMYGIDRSAVFKYNLLSDGDAESLNITHVMVPTLITTLQVSNGSNALPFARGVLPGLHTSSFGGYRTVLWPKELVVNDVTWVLLRSYFSAQNWIKTGTWYD